MITIESKSVVCVNCGSYFWVDEVLYNQRQKDGKSFFCPNGHEQRFSTETDGCKLRDAIKKIEGLETKLKEAEAENLTLKDGNRQLKCELLKFQQEKAVQPLLKKLGIT